jgi:DNA end-binding protein Ku
MPRPTWTGSIAFGLVSIPVKLHPATESRRIAFHEMEEGSGQRIRYKRVAERSGREVPWKKIQRAFEIKKGSYVVLTDDELAAAAPTKTRAVEIEQFVDLGEIDPVSWDHSYYVVPDGSESVKAFSLLRQAMDESHRVAIGRFIMRTKEYLVCIRPFGRLMVLETMFFPGTAAVPAGRPAGDRAPAPAADADRWPLFMNSGGVPQPLWPAGAGVGSGRRMSRRRRLALCASVRNSHTGSSKSQSGRSSVKL